MNVQCPAKVNLFLEITGVRKDGYHTLATLFAKINVYDVLHFAAASGGRPVLEIESEPGLPSLSAGDDNLIMRAAHWFYERFKVGQGVRITLTKRIPMGAGLGGGSSDAAGTLRGLLRFFKMKPDAKMLGMIRNFASKLGADIPFFLRPEPLCLGAGIGDRLRPVPAKKSLPYMILVYPGIHISTAEAYRNIKKPGRPAVLTRLSQLDKLVSALKKGRPVEEWGDLLFNRLEEAEIPALSQVAQARTILERLGARGVRMSGSGSSVFGFVASHREGEECVRRLRGYPWKVFLTSCQG